MSIVENITEGEIMNEIIKQLISSSPDQMISYADYIGAALYHPEKGYYMKKNQKIGKTGDYYTTSNVSNIYGYLLGKWFALSAEKLGLEPVVMEIGGGTGRFARDFVQGWTELSDLVLTYYLVEVSPFHREVQAQLLTGLNQVEIVQISTVGEAGMKEGLVFSNELFDAFPVHVVEKKDGMVFEVFVAYENDQFIEKKKPLMNEGIIAYIHEQGIELVDSQRMEVPLAMEPFVKSIADHLDKGIMISADYGYSNEEWQSPARRNGSLRGYFQHQMYHDILQNPGDMDITSHVHFDALIAQGEKHGLHFFQKKRQDEFLISLGILDELKDHFDPNPFSEASKRNRAIRSLILPGSISQSFEIIIQGKDIDTPPDQLFSK